MNTTFITAQLGQVDELTMAKILELGVDEDDIVEARFRLDEDALDLGLPEPSDRVTRLLDLVTPLWKEWEDSLIEA